MEDNKENMMRTWSRKIGAWTGAPLLALIMTLAFATKAEAQQHYESASESYNIGNNKFGAGLDLFAEFKHTPTKVRAYGSVEGTAKFFNNNINILDGFILSQVNNGTSTNKAKLKLFGFTLINQNNPVQWQWSQVYNQQIGQPVTYSFPLFWGLSVDVGCEMSSGVYADMKIGVASLVGAGLDGSVGPRVDVEVYAALSVTLIVIKAQVALVANFILFDYTLNIEGTISPCGANVHVFTKFEPLQVTVYLKLRYKTWSLWSGWSSWKTKKTWKLWSWSLASVNHTILQWVKSWCKGHRIDVEDVQMQMKTDAVSNMERVKSSRSGKADRRMTLEFAR